MTAPHFCGAALLTAAALALTACGGTAAKTESMPGTSSGSASSSTPAITTASAPASTTGPVTKTATGSARSPHVSGCPTSHLALVVVGAQGAAGTAFLTYALRNLGPGNCSMIGYPGVAVLDAEGRIVQHAATRGTRLPQPVRQVTLAPRRQATFLINSSDVIPSPGCPKAYTGRTLQVIPPNQVAPLRVPYRGSFCNLRVGPVQPASQ